VIPPDRLLLWSHTLELPDEEIDLALGALQIAQDAYPELDISAYLRRLDHLADLFRPRLGLTATPRAASLALANYLFFEQDFRGNTGDYFNADNNFLNVVLDRRSGIPITLSIIFLEVGWRLNLPLSGVGLPGHFLVRCDDPERPTLFDPFYRTSDLTEADCQARLDHIYGGKVHLQPAHLHPTSKRAILSRLLNNLKSVYVQEGAAEKALTVVERLVSLNPQDWQERRNRGLLHYHLGHVRPAISDLDRYLEFTPDAPDAPIIRRYLFDLWQKLDSK